MNSKQEHPAPSCTITLEESERRVAEARNHVTFWGLVLKVGHIVLLLLLPWAVWMTTNIFELRGMLHTIQLMQSQMATNTQLLRQHDIQFADFAAWRSLGPRFTPADGEALRLKVVNEIQSQMLAQISDINSKLAQLQRDTIELQVLMRSHLTNNHTQKAP